MSASVADTHDKGPRILAVVWTLSTLTTIFVAARVYIRQWLIRNAGIDDYIIVVSLVMPLGYLRTSEPHSLPRTVPNINIRGNDHSKCAYGIRKACLVPGAEHRGDDKFGQHNQLCNRHFLLYHSKSRSNRSFDSDPQSQPFTAYMAMDDDWSYGFGVICMYIFIGVPMRPPSGRMAAPPRHRGQSELQ
ncbi:hypothetical protein AFCA_012721 [Aspergillus flavus]|nr:hypothetical protein AFCA_012721 [Aspergillus flavus]